MALYPYQQRVKELLLNHKSVILQAPTGSGKTRAALEPYIQAMLNHAATDFPRRCLYSVPMRVLANQFHAEMNQAAASFTRRFHRHLDVRVQTGERAEDPRFLGDITFATIDQTLSSALAVPYSLSPSLANLNTGALLSSYLIFDEFHLFPSGGEDGIEGALVTTLQLLMRLKGYVPYILMTATFSSAMLQRLATLLDAEVVTVSPDEYQMIAQGRSDRPRTRTFIVDDAPLCAESIVSTHQQRTIVVCNQVGRAQALYRELTKLTANSTIEVILLHSRFTAAHRKAKEDAVRADFGENGAPTKSIILVATQVVEVGLNITCEHLYTELAPANAVLQRAGRCARYPGQQGVVHVCRPPYQERQDTADESRIDYLPYPRAVCERTWMSLMARSGRVVDFQEEQRIIDEVHTEDDGRLLEAMARQEGMLWRDIMATLDSHDTAARANLIRRIDNITVLVAETPEAIGNPFAAKGFGFFRGSVMGIYRKLEDIASRKGEAEESPWRMAYPTVSDSDPDDPTSLPQVTWHNVLDVTQLRATPIVVLNQAFCAYDMDLGFRIESPTPATRWTSTPGEFAAGNRRNGFSYKLESYETHIQTMLAIYDHCFAADYAYIERRLAERGMIPPGGLTRAIRLAIACHDLAKLDIRWQLWVRAYQNALGEPLPNDNYMAVHTHWEPELDTHQAAMRSAKRQAKRPRHAGESAVAVGPIVAEVIGKTFAPLGRAVCTAIARHHSPKTQAFDDFSLHPAAADSLRIALLHAGFVAVNGPVMCEKGRSLEKWLIRPEFEQQMLYLLVVRMLRLCDGLSQEK